MILAETVIIALVAFRLFTFLGRDSLTKSLRQRLERWPMVWEWATCAWCSGTWYAVGLTLATFFAGLIEGSPWLVAPAAACLVGILGERV